MTFFGLLSLIVVHKLFVLQIVNGEDYLENYTLSISKKVITTGTRGNIYDRDGEILATNRLAYSVQIEDNGSYNDTTQKNKLINETINTVIDLVEANGDKINSDFGILFEKNEYQFQYAEGIFQHKPCNPNNYLLFALRLLTHNTLKNLLSLLFCCIRYMP
mgnify:CR=1 FL=1